MTDAASTAPTPASSTAPAEDMVWETRGRRMVTIYLPLICFVIILLFFVDSIAKALLPDAYFRGIERMKDITIRAVSAKSGILVATLLFVKGDDTLIIYPVSMIVFDTIALLWAFSLLKRDGLKATSTSPSPTIGW